jgi:pyruvate dehydrogenase kinase 2/3/4
MTWRATKELMAQIHHFASFPQTSVSLQQMVQFGRIRGRSHVNYFRIRTLAWNFIKSKSIPCRYVSKVPGGNEVDELPVRLARRVKDLDQLPDKLHEMPSIQKVKNWYAESFEVIPTL